MKALKYVVYAAGGLVAPARVRMGARAEVKARGGEWVPAEIGVGGLAD